MNKHRRRIPDHSNRFFIITGPPGSGKTALIAALKAEGYSCVDEPARRVIAEQRKTGGRGTSEQDPALFVELMGAQAIVDYDAALGMPGPVFFDRGLPDLIAYADALGIDPRGANTACANRGYNQIVFFAPPWRSIFTNDEERTLSFTATESFAASLKRVYEDLGYQLLLLPFVSVIRRVDFMLSSVGLKR